MNNHLEILKTFTGNDPLRPIFDEPFLIENTIYATDARIMAWTASVNVDKEIKPYDKPENITKVIPTEINQDFEIKLNTLKGIFDNAPMIDEVEVIGGDVDCPECDGKGEVEWEYDYHTKEMDCPLCDGSGLKENKEEVKTGNKILDGSKAIKIGRFNFRIDLLKKIYDAALSTKSKNIKLVHQLLSKDGSLFEFNDFKVLIMSVNCREENVIYTIENDLIASE